MLLTKPLTWLFDVSSVSSRVRVDRAKTELSNEGATARRGAGATAGSNTCPRIFSAAEISGPGARATVGMATKGDPLPVAYWPSQ